MPHGCGRKRTKTYTCNFQVHWDEGFPTPSGASWLDFAFHECANGPVVVSVAEKRKFRARLPQTDGGQRTTEVAEQLATITRTDEGSAFIELLRAAGILPRRSDHVVALTLAKRLREWTGLDGDPLRLVETSQCWTGVFGCSSETAEAGRAFVQGSGLAGNRYASFILFHYCPANVFRATGNPFLC